MELTRQDLDTLIEAVEAWEAKDFTTEMISTMIDGSFARGLNREDVERVKAEAAARRKKLERESRVRRERSVLLRAKLITIRDAREAAAFLDDAAAR